MAATAIVIYGCAEIRLPIPLNAETPAAFNFPKAPVASPTDFFTSKIAELRFGNDNSKSAITSLNVFKSPPTPTEVDLTFAFYVVL